MLRDSPQNFIISYDAAMQTLANTLQQYKTSLSLNFIQKLSDDVLLHILHESLESDLDPEDLDDPMTTDIETRIHCHPGDAIRLSHVSKRFYRLITEDGSFWDSLHDTFGSRKLVEACAERGRTKGLFVGVDFTFYPGNKMSLDNFLEAAVPHEGRWTTLVIDAHDGVSGDQYKILKSRLQNLQLTRLERLVVNYGRKDPDIEDLDISRGPRMEIFSNALLPHLRDAKFVNCIPPPSLSMPLTSLDIEFGTFGFGSEFQGWDFTPFLAFLQSTTTLTTLTMTFTCDGPAFGGPFEAIVPSTAIPQVTRLQLSTYDVPSPTLRKFADAVRFPGVDTLAIKHTQVDEDGSEDEDEDEDSETYFSLQSLIDLVLSSATEHFPDLSKLTIFSGTSKPYTIPFRSLPKLRHLQIYGTVTPSYNTTVQSLRALPAIDVLELVRCKKVDVRWVEQVVDLLKARNHWERFRKLIIDNCKGADADLFSFVPRDKLSWKPYVYFSWVLLYTSNFLITSQVPHSLGIRRKAC